MKLWPGVVLAAALIQAAPAFAQSPKNAPKDTAKDAPKNATKNAPKTTAKTPVAPPALQRDFDDFLVKFRAALTANDAAAVAGMTRLPFMKDDAIRDAAQFGEKVYKRHFTASSRACIGRGKAIYDRDGENNDNFLVFCGEKIFVFSKTPEGFLFTDIDGND